MLFYIRMKKVLSFLIIVTILFSAQKGKEDEKKALLIGGAAIILALPLDRTVRTLATEKESAFADGIAEFSNYFGDGRVLVPFIALTAIDGLILSDKKLVRTSLEAGESFIIAGTIANAIKTITMRKRPSVSESPFSFSWGNRSFPSGHVTVASAVSTIFAREYNCKTFYLIPVLTSFARIRKNAHWLSDTIAGFTLGYVVGSYVVRKNGFFAIYPTMDGFVITIGIGGKNASSF